MATLIWTEPAVADLEEIGQFISKNNPPAAEKVGSKIIREAENVAAFPRLGRIVPEFGNPQIGVDPTVVSPAAILQQEHSFLRPNTKA